MVKSTLPPGDKKSSNSDDEPPRHWTHQVQGGKYIKQLEKFVQTLRQEDSQSAHGNQKLFLDDVFITYLSTGICPHVKSAHTFRLQRTG
ncbi:MAG: hypothetical protein JKY95_15020 [Planctomycetaceae bacterium]|nr:hypothetical protein [Planctomycetaceae bacterium]